MYFPSKYFFQEEFGGKPLDLSELSNVSTSCPSITQKRMKEWCVYSLHFSNFLWEEKGLCYLIYCMLHTLGHGLYLSLSSFLQHLASHTVYMPHQSKGIKLDFLSSCFCHFRTPDKMWGRTLWLRAVFTSACMNSSKNIFKTSLFTLLAAAATIRPSSMVNWTFDQ